MEARYTRLGFYVFGGIVSNRCWLNDLDLLVVYKDIADIEGVRSELDDLSLRVPLDITYMHFDEERELNFVSRQRALSLGAVWPNKSFKPTSTPPLRSGAAAA